VDKGWGKKRLIRLQVHPYGYRVTGVILPVRKYLQALAPQTFSHSGTSSAVSSTWHTLAGIPVALYLSALPVERRLK
jgi:hypothetical protein